MKWFSCLLTLCVFPLLAKEPSYEEVADLNRLKIETPSLSCQKRAKIRLNNGMEVLLISDPLGTQSAAALCMEVGSWSDPTEYPGMAHFVEHLIHLGNQTYPEENSYSKHVTKNGGMLNAFTTNDRTVYAFLVKHAAFCDTLHRFSHMFIDPLFDASSMRRELRAVDQEHDKNIENESFRTSMILSEIGNPDHPNSRFKGGNRVTLENLPRAVVLKWYQENYSSDKSHLVLYSDKSIDALKKLTISHFCAAPLRKSPKARFSQKLISYGREGMVTHITPLTTGRELELYWELPRSFFTDKENNTDRLLSHILNSRHEGSLHSQLKEEKLITRISAGLDPLSKESGFYTISIELTPQGVKQRARVQTLLFQALKTLKKHGIPRYLFDEIYASAKLDYAYQERTSSFEWITHLAYEMAEEPLETFPQKSTLSSVYKPKKISDFLNHLDPHKAQYILKAPSEESQVGGEMYEKWSGAEYAVRKVDKSTLLDWSLAPSDTLSIYPKPNPYIPSNFELLTTQKGVERVPIPKLLTSDNYGKIYYWEDERYFVPEIAWIISFKTAYLEKSAKKFALSDLFRICLSDHLNEEAHYANAASLEHSIKTDDACKLILHLTGFHEKAAPFLEKIINALRTSTWTKEEFELGHASLMANYQSFQKSPPYHQGLSLLKHTFLNNYPRASEKLIALQETTYEDFIHFRTHLLKELYVEALLAGNMNKEKAQEVWQMVRKTLNFTPLTEEKSIETTYLALPSDVGPFKIGQKIEALGSCAILALQTGLFSFKESASMSLLGTAMAPDFFDALRTKQQAAYIAKSFQVDENGGLCQLFLVQSSTHKPEELIDRFELFLEGYVNDFESKISRKSFEEIKESLITKSKKPPESLFGMAELLYTLGFKYDSDFHHVEKKIEAMSSLSYEEFKKSALRCLARKNPKRLAFLIEGRAPEGKGFEYQHLSIEELKELATYLTWAEICDEKESLKRGS